MKFKTALIISIILHLGLVALLIINFQFSKIEIKATGTTQLKINAKAVNSKRVEQLVEKIKKDKLDTKRKEQKRLDDLKKAEENAKRKRREEEKKAAYAAERTKAAERKRKAEEKKAEDLKKKRISDEKKRKKKEAEDKKIKEAAERKKKADAEKKRKAEEVRKRKAKEKAAREKKAAEEKARQEAIEREMMAAMDSEAAELEAANQAQINSEVAKFSILIRNKVYRNWIAPEQKGYCVFKLQVAQGGLVIGVTVLDGDAQHCVSGKRAIFKSEPLPVSKDPDVFEVLKSINLTLGEKEKNE
jgi:colicin import membrane protein